MARIKQPERVLSAEQQQVIAALAEGKTEGQAAELAGLPVEDIAAWRDRDPVFVAELNRRRKVRWASDTERLRGLVGQAVDTLAGCLTSDDEKMRHMAAVSILKATGLFGQDLEPTGPTRASDVEAYGLSL